MAAITAPTSAASSKKKKKTKKKQSCKKVVNAVNKNVLQGTKHAKKHKSNHRPTQMKDQTVSWASTEPTATTVKTKDTNKQASKSKKQLNAQPKHCNEKPLLQQLDESTAANGQQSKPCKAIDFSKLIEDAKAVSRACLKRVRSQSQGEEPLKADHEHKDLEVQSIARDGKESLSKTKQAKWKQQPATSLSLTSSQTNELSSELQRKQETKKKVRSKTTNMAVNHETSRKPAKEQIVDPKPASKKARKKEKLIEDLKKVAASVSNEAESVKDKSKGADKRNRKGEKKTAASEVAAQAFTSRPHGEQESKKAQESTPTRKTKSEKEFLEPMKAQATKEQQTKRSNDLKHVQDAVSTPSRPLHKVGKPVTPKIPIHVQQPTAMASVTCVASSSKKRHLPIQSNDAPQKKKARRGGQKQKRRRENQVGTTTDSANGPNSTYLSNERFTDLDISPTWKRAIAKEFKFKFLTKIQKQTLSHVLEGKDVLAKAKTGHGKTLAFLLPLMELLLTQINKRKAQDNSLNAELGYQSIPFLIVSPTRELAQQIYDQAQRLCQYHRDFRVACFVGQQTISKDQALLGSRIDFLISTPGRLLDHLHNDYGHIQSRIAKLQVLVLDEADRLLDMGFRTSIMEIVQFLPAKESRQTLLFSATFPEAMEEMKQLTLREDHAEEISIDGSEEDPGQPSAVTNSATNTQVQQSYGVCSMDRMIGIIEAVLTEHCKQNQNFKVMVFFNTARETAFMATAFEKAGYNVLEMHSKKSQSHRTSVSTRFRDGRRVMMFCSDVSARGMDYPDVSLVLQVGFVRRDVYIHRLGRTARAGKEGEGVLLLGEFEAEEALKELEGIPLMEKDVARYNVLKGTISLVLACVSTTPELCKLAELSYQSWLCANAILAKRFSLNRHQVVSLANEFAKAMGLTRVPALSTETAKKMRLYGAPGLLLKGSHKTRS